MNVKGLLAGVGVMLLVFGCARQAYAQAAPGDLADANNPSGAPDPEKNDEIWQVDPISGQVSINIPFTTTPQGGRGPKIPFKLSYNSGSTLTLQSDGVHMFSTWNPTVTNVLTALLWSASPDADVSSLVAPSGPWTTSGPYFNVNGTTVSDRGYTMYEGSYTYMIGCSIWGPYNYTDENGGTHDLNLTYYQQNPVPYRSNV